MANTPTKPTFQFPRNQCVACNKITSDQYHPVLLFGLAGKFTAAKFQSLTGLSLSVSDSFPKKICLSCKTKVEAAANFKEMCLNSRKEQQSMLQGRVKRGKNPGESPNAKRNPAEGEEPRCNRVVARYKQILPKPNTTEEPKNTTKKPAKNSTEEHALRKHGCDNPKVSGGCFTSLVELSDITTV